MKKLQKTIVLISPRGFCAGVERAVKIVDLTLKKFNTPLYIKHQIVHNTHVVKDFEKRGIIFVENIEDIPNQSTAIFSAHGSKVSDYEIAKSRGIKVIDATCPLVTKVHIEAKLYAKKGYFVIYIGHEGHPETIGVLSNIQDDKKVLIETHIQATNLILKTNKAVILTQTTLSFDDTKQILDILKKKFPFLIIPPAYDVCYATQNRQEAVKKLAAQVDMVLVIGSKNSSNSNRLAEVAKKNIPSYLIDDENDLKPDWFTNINKVGITSGASAPEKIVFKVIDKLKEKGFTNVKNLEVIQENVKFPLPYV